MPYFHRKPYAEMTSALAPVAPGAAEAPILSLAETVLTEQGGTPGSAFRARRPVRPGETARLTLRFAVDGSAGAVTLRFAADELTGPGPAIGAAHVAVSPAEATVRGDVAAVVEVAVAIPAGAAPGLYRGRLRVSGDERFDEAFEVMVAG